MEICHKKAQKLVLQLPKDLLSHHILILEASMEKGKVESRKMYFLTPISC